MTPLLPTPAGETLDALQHDALVELFNIGVGRAANALGEIVGEEVTMSVPTIRFLPRAQARSLLASSSAGEARVCGVRQHYDGGFRTEAIIMFAEDACLDLVRLMVGDAVPADELTAMEQEAMGEIGNIVLNSCLGTLADLLEQELCGSLPV
ncbi:MAG: chemotaxis protein CheC, partial [Massilia sp.]